jgi:ABC-2 type transport system ATP-binding protein
MIILETNKLTKRFGDLIAVDDFSIAMPEGEVFVLLGPNGAGKSTVIKMLTTLLPPTSGSASVAGFDVTKQSAAVRRLIGYVPQMISADGTLSGYENLLVFAKLYDIPGRERKQRIQDALAFMGLTDSANSLVKTYSGGMIRRLEIAQSMLHRPRMLFLDEPTVGLDPAARHMVWEHLSQLRDEFGATIMVTTHLMEEADELCQRVAIMHHGTVRAIGAPDALKESLGREGATLDDVFMHYAGDTLDVGGGYRDVTRQRRTARRLG